MADNHQQAQLDRPWEKPPDKLADIGAFITEYAADHDRYRTSLARWRVLRRVQHETDSTLSEIPAQTLRTWWLTGGTRRIDGQPRSRATRQAMRSHLSTFFRWCVLRGIRSDDPTVHLPSVTVRRRDPRPADRADLDRILASITGRERRALLLASELGLRCMEIAPLRRDHLQRTPAGTWEMWIVRKGGHELRLDVPGWLAAELTEIPRGIPFVPALDGSHLTEASMSRLINDVFRRHGSSIRAHKLRHLAATELLDETDGDIRGVADQMGHRNLNTTGGYTQPGRAVVDALERRRR